MNPIGITITAILAAIILTGSRLTAALGVFGAVCYTTQGQQIEIAGFHFTAIRMIILLGFVRIVIRKEWRDLTFNKIDWVVLLYPIVLVTLSSWRNRNMLVYQLGIGYDVFFSYFIFRGLITTWEDARGLVYGLAILILPLALGMVYESFTGQSAFKFLGGQVLSHAPVREGRYRCSGSFRGAHTAGTFGATLLPLFLGMFLSSPRKRGILVVAMVAATIITYTSNASGPLTAYMCCGIGLAFWGLRKSMKAVRWAILVGVTLLGLVMKAPIWYLIAKFSSLTGGDGWHRSYLMDQCAQHISDWWLMGTDDTSEWAVTLMPWGGADITNQYVSCAANAGLLCVTLFMMMLVYCFSNLGKALRIARAQLPEAERLLWCLGTALFAHAITLTSVTYWDQMYVPWWGLLGIISGLTDDFLRHADETVPAESHVVRDEPIDLGDGPRGEHQPL